MAGDETSGLSIQSFSSHAYHDIAAADGVAMFCMTDDGAMYVGNRKYFSREANGEGAEFHSSLVNGKPVICAGLFTTEGRHKEIEQISIFINSSGHYRGELASLQLLLQSKKYKAVLSMVVTPGWVKTDMGTDKARLTVETSVAKMAAVIEQVAITREVDRIHEYCELDDGYSRRLG